MDNDKNNENETLESYCTYLIKKEKQKIADGQRDIDRLLVGGLIAIGILVVVLLISIP